MPAKKPPRFYLDMLPYMEAYIREIEANGHAHHSIMAHKQYKLAKQLVTTIYAARNRKAKPQYDFTPPKRITTN